MGASARVILEAAVCASVPEACTHSCCVTCVACVCLCVCCAGTWSQASVGYVGVGARLHVRGSLWGRAVSLQSWVCQQQCMHVLHCLALPGGWASAASSAAWAGV